MDVHRLHITSSFDLASSIDIENTLLSPPTKNSEDMKLKSCTATILREGYDSYQKSYLKMCS